MLPTPWISARSSAAASRRAAASRVCTHYDAMLAKVVAWAQTRDAAARRLAAAVERAEIHGVGTNRDLLDEVLRSPAFRAADVATDFLERHDLASLTARPTDPGTLRVAAFAAAVTLSERAWSARAVQAAVPTGWRNVVSQPQRTVLEHDGDEVVAEWYGGRDGHRSLDGLRARPSEDPSVLAVSTRDGSAHQVRVHVDGDQVDVESAAGHVALTVVPRFVDPADQVASGSLLAPMPGSVVRVDVGVGQPVEAGQPVLVLEAMKMQHTVKAPTDGVVTQIDVKAGAQVAAGEVLAVVEDSVEGNGQ